MNKLYITDLLLCRAKEVSTGKWVEGYYSPVATYHNNKLSGFKHAIAVPTNFHHDEIDISTLSRFTGYTLYKGDKVFEGTIAFDEDIHDGEDRRIYLVCIYIHEWSMFAWLAIWEYQKYLEGGADVLDETMFFTYTMGDSDKYHHAGNIFDNPELLE